MTKKVFTVLLLLVGVVQGIRAQKSTFYVVLSSDNTIATYYYDDEKVNRGGIFFNDYVSKGGKKDVTTIVLDKSLANYATSSVKDWFSDHYKLIAIKGMEYLNTSNVKDMYNMFNDCSSLTSLDLSSFDTSNVTKMGRMFCSCRSLTSLDLSSFNTSKVTDMYYCSKAAVP